MWQHSLIFLRQSLGRILSILTCEKQLAAEPFSYLHENHCVMLWNLQGTILRESWRGECAQQNYHAWTVCADKSICCKGWRYPRRRWELHLRRVSTRWREAVDEEQVGWRGPEHAGRLTCLPFARRGLESCLQRLNAVPAYRCCELKHLRGGKHEYSGQRALWYSSKMEYLALLTRDSCKKNKEYPTGKRKHAILCKFKGHSVSSKNKPGQIKMKEEY